MRTWTCRRCAMTVYSEGQIATAVEASSREKKYGGKSCDHEFEEDGQ